MQPSPDDQPNPTDRPGTPPRPPYSPVTPVLSHLAPVPNNNTNGTDFPASSAPFSASPSHPIVPPPARSPSPTTRIAPPSIPALHSNVNSHSHFQNQNLLNHADISISTPFSAPPPPPAAFTTPSQTSPPQQQQQQQQQGQQSQLPRPTFIPEPSPIPISESENPDAIALRSAISILQMQKQQSMRDLRTLERLKKAAAADPEAFARELAAGNLSAKTDVGEFLGLDPMRRGEDDDEGDGEEEEEDGVDVGGGGGREEGGSRVKFETIPTPQNVVRMPPVNWAKYHIVGDPLDRMHEDQRRRPFSGEPRREVTQRAPEHVLASPYRPLVDKLETPSKVKGASKSKKT